MVNQEKISSDSKKATKPIILLVEDEEMLRDHISFYLSNEYEVMVASTGSDALEKLKQNPVDVILLDIYLPDILGTELIPLFKQIRPKTEIIVITAYKEIHLATDSIQYGAADFLTKPFQKMDLLVALSKIIQKKEIATSIDSIQFTDSKYSYEKSLKEFKELIIKRKETQTKITMQDIYEYFPDLKSTHFVGTTEIPFALLENKEEKFILSLFKSTKTKPTE